MDYFLTLFTATELAMCCGIVMFAAILQVSVGMGFGMLASPLIALVRPDLIPASILLMGMVVAFAGAWKERANISLSELKLGISGRILGSFGALVALALIRDIDSFLILFGILVLVAVGLTASGLKIAFTGKSLFHLSVVSGLMGTITAVGAPPMAIIYHDRPPSNVRPTLNAFFGAGSVLGLAGLGLTGWLSVTDFIAAAMFLPAMFAGIWFAEPFKLIPTIWLSRILLSLSAVAAVSLIARGLF